MIWGKSFFKGLRTRRSGVRITPGALSCSKDVCRVATEHDMVIALLDGPQVDDGAAWEIGHFYSKRSPEQKIVEIRTDFRLLFTLRSACVMRHPVDIGLSLD